jgi:hypothetical protein
MLYLAHGKAFTKSEPPGGRTMSVAKAKSSRANGKLGDRPKKPVTGERL